MSLAGEILLDILDIVSPNGDLVCSQDSPLNFDAGTNRFGSGNNIEPIAVPIVLGILELPAQNP